MGPLGIAIALGLAGYVLYKFAETKNSNPWEVWAKRCFFGIANETQKVHWNRSEHASDALGELNAITIGVLANLEFLFDSAMELYSKHGVLTDYHTLELKPDWTFKLAYRLILPYYDESRSGFKWMLIIHRAGDKSAEGYLSGELLAEGELNMPNPGEVGNSYLAPEKNIRVLASPEGLDNIGHAEMLITPVEHERFGTLQVLDINNTIELQSGLSKKRIEAATLSLMYWPDRTMIEGYSKITDFKLR